MALPGIVTGITLGAGHIAGETAPVLPAISGGVVLPDSQVVDIFDDFQLQHTPPFATNPELM